MANSLVVHTSPPHPDGPHVYPDGRYKVDEAGILHVFRLREGRNVMLAAYSAGEWGSAIHREDES